MMMSFSYKQTPNTDQPTHNVAQIRVSGHHYFNNQGVSELQNLNKQAVSELWISELTSTKKYKKVLFGETDKDRPRSLDAGDASPVPG